MVYFAANSPGACFVEGTLVAAEDGLRPIEEIKAGDYVWAEEPEAGERALKCVIQTFLKEKDERIHIQVGGETITCTTEHPFYVQGKGWVAAQDLKPNDKLELRDGEDAFVDAVRYEKLDKPIPVFNFEVEGFHTYYVMLVLVVCWCIIRVVTMEKNGIRSERIIGNLKVLCMKIKLIQRRYQPVVNIIFLKII